MMATIENREDLSLDPVYFGGPSNLRYTPMHTTYFFATILGFIPYNHLEIYTQRPGLKPALLCRASPQHHSLKT